MSVNKTIIIRWIKAHWLIVGCSFLGVVFAALAAYRYNAAVSVDSELLQVQDKLDTMRRNVRAASGLAGDLGRINAYGARVDSSLMDKDAKAVNLAYFYEVGADNEVRVTRVVQNEVVPPQSAAKPGAAAKPQKPVLSAYDQIRFDIGITGSFANILGYVDAVRRDHPFIRVDLISISPATNAPGRTEDASLNITVLTPPKGKTK